MEWEVFLVALLIFGLRVLNNAIGTVRLIVMTDGRRGLATALAFFESLIFAFTAAKVLTDLSNIPYLMAYALGFAVGSYVGMILEGRFITGYVSIEVITTEKGAEIAVALREEDYGVTETSGHGTSSDVSMLHCVVDRRDIMDVLSIIRRVKPDAFVTVNSARLIQHGWIRHNRGHRK